jgi:hypothetical protein
MKIQTHHSMGTHLERTVIAFFILAATSLLVVYVADPAIYAQSLALTSSPVERYPVPVTLFLVGILIVIALLILGVVRHWLWVFWLMLGAFAGSALHIPITLLQMTGVLPTSDPLWYGLFRMGVAAFEFALAVWMIHIYRHEGVWGLGKKRNER